VTSPVDVLSQPEKNTKCARVCALGQHDLLIFAECRTNKFSAHHVRVPSSFGISPTCPLTMVETSACSQASPFQAWLSLLLLHSLSGQHPFAALLGRRAASLRGWRL